MRYVYSALASSACVSILAACSAASGSVPAPNSSTLSSLVAITAATGPCGSSKIYVADYSRNDVEIFPGGNLSNPAPCGRLTTGIANPLSVYVDSKGRVYVSNYSSTGSTYAINEFARGQKTPALTIQAAGPGYDMFVGKNGVLYVAEATQNAVVEYAPGATTPKLTIPINGSPYGVTSDASYNLYVSYLSNADVLGHVEKFAPGKKTGTDMGFTVSLGGAVRLDNSGDVIIGDRNNNVIDIFPAGQTTPSRSWGTAGKPQSIALEQTETYLYTPAFGSVQIFDYATGTQAGTISNHLIEASSVAPYPPAPYY